MKNGGSVMSKQISKYLFQNENSNNSDFKIHKRIFPMGTTFLPHWHDYLELELVISGSLNHALNNTSYISSRGSSFMISYYDFHELTALEDTEIACIQFNNHFLEHEMTNYLSTNSLLCDFTENEMAKIVESIENMFREQEQNLLFREYYIKSLLTEIILQMIRKTNKHQSLSTPLPIQQIIAYIADNYLDNITLDSIAHKFAFSTNYLGRLFKAQTGYQFNEYLNLLRLKHACNLLQKSPLAIKEIAFQSGYHSVEYFLYIFKKNMQMTPSEYKRLFSDLDVEIVTKK